MRLKLVLSGISDIHLDCLDTQIFDKIITLLTTCYQLACQIKKRSIRFFNKAADPSALVLYSERMGEVCQAHDNEMVKRVWYIIWALKRSRFHYYLQHIIYGIHIPCLHVSSSAVGCKEVQGGQEYGSPQETYLMSASLSRYLSRRRKYHNKSFAHTEY